MRGEAIRAPNYLRTLVQINYKALITKLLAFLMIIAFVRVVTAFFFEIVGGSPRSRAR